MKSCMEKIAILILVLFKYEQTLNLKAYPCNRDWSWRMNHCWTFVWNWMKENFMCFWNALWTIPVCKIWQKNLDLVTKAHQQFTIVLRRKSRINWGGKEWYSESSYWELKHGKGRQWKLSSSNINCFWLDALLYVVSLMKTCIKRSVSYYLDL